MVTSRPLVSVVVPSFKMARYLPEMLDSTLAQDYRPLEILVVDGASTDGTTELLGDYAERHPEIRWISEPDDGPADAVNKGLAMARGDYVAIQNADDLYRPGALALAVRTLEAHPGCSFVYGDLQGIGPDGDVRYTRRFPDFSWPAFLAWSLTFAQSSIVFRRALVERIGGWNPAYYGCDLDYWLRLALQAPPVHIPAVLSAWRLHPGQRTRPDQFARICRDYRRMIEECAELQQTSPRMRRMARASVHLLAMRFPPSDSRWRRFGHMVAGLALHPTAVRYQPWQRFARAVPGSEWLQCLRTNTRRPRWSRAE